MIDEADYGLFMEYGWFWKIETRGYVVRVHPGRRRVALHNAILRPATGFEVDHMFGDRLDNRRSRLRQGTKSQNMANKDRQGNGYRGVYRTGRRWYAQITHHDRKHRLGTFTTPEGAARAYDRAAVERFGEFARTNFPCMEEP